MKHINILKNKIDRADYLFFHDPYPIRSDQNRDLIGSDRLATSKQNQWKKNLKKLIMVYL